MQTTILIGAGVITIGLLTIAKELRRINKTLRQGPKPPPTEELATHLDIVIDTKID